MVIIGPDALSAGLADDIWTDIIALPENGLPNLQDLYLDPAWRMQEQGQGKGVLVSYYPSGPLLDSIPDRVPNVPKTAAELLDWTRPNPKQILYPTPTTSPPAPPLLMGPASFT